MDDIDLAQQRQQDEIDHALAARRAKGQGTSECVECAGAVSVLRQGMGATLCLECQRRLELQGKQWNRRS